MADTSILDKIALRTAPTTNETLFFLVNQQAIVNGQLLAVLTSMVEGDQAKAIEELRSALKAHLKLGRRIDALMATGNANVD